MRGKKTQNCEFIYRTAYTSADIKYEMKNFNFKTLIYLKLISHLISSQPLLIELETSFNFPLKHLFFYYDLAFVSPVYTHTTMLRQASHPISQYLHLLKAKNLKKKQFNLPECL